MVAVTIKRTLSCERFHPAYFTGWEVAKRREMDFMSYIRKTKDEYQLLCNYGYGDGWEYVLAEDTMKEARDRKKRIHEEYARILL